MIKKDIFHISSNIRPKVLLLGNGMLRLGNGGTSWSELLQLIQTRNGKFDVSSSKVPYAMQPEVFCGVNVEQIQRDISKNIKSVDNHHPLLKKLLAFPFDAILTTNYTYEIESILSGKQWQGGKERKKAFTALDGNTSVHHNTNICNAVKCLDGRTIPVFHIHGEAERKHSMILSYYSYANSLSKLLTYNKEILKDSLYEHQVDNIDYQCKCWLDYFIMGDVFSVGFSLDTSEFDIWWAIERKAREKADHGIFIGYFGEKNKQDTAQKLLLEAMKAEYRPVAIMNDDYEEMYRKIVCEIETKMIGNK